MSQGKYNRGMDRPDRNYSRHSSSINGQELTSWGILHANNQVPSTREPMVVRPHLYASLQSGVVLAMADQAA